MSALKSLLSRSWMAWLAPRRLVAWGDPSLAPADRLHQGSAAARLLHDPVLALAFARIEERLLATWRGSAIGAGEEREAAYRMLWAIEEVKAQLRAILGNRQILDADAKKKEAAEQRRQDLRERGMAG